MHRPATSYWDYIQVESLLGLQGGLGRDEPSLGNDEVLFITVHQVFELWFKLIHRELRSARDLFGAPFVREQELSGVVHSLERIATLFRASTQHWEVMETLSTREYLGFRDKLMGASGFQSAHLRQIEILFGLQESERIALGLEGSYLEALKAADGAVSPAHVRVTQALADRPPFKEAIDGGLYRTPIDGVAPTDRDAQASLQRFADKYLAAHGRAVDQSATRALEIALNDADRERLRRRYAVEKESVRLFLNPDEAEGGAHLQRVRCAMVFIETYRELALLAWPRQLLDGLVQVEQLFVVFRQRHARMVERIIGRRTGTGGSAGVDYLDATALKYRVFRDLWAIRTIQIPRELAPELEHAEFYGFRSGT
jgi:tryptophan 2,3-dioxygenase